MDLIPAQYYSDIYIFVITILTIIYFKRYCDNSAIGADSQSNRVLFISVLFSLFIGFRPISPVFADMVGYDDEWSMHAVNDFQISKDVTNYIFDNLRIYMASSFFSSREFFVLISFIYFIGMAVACNLLFPQGKLLAFLVCLSAFSTFSYATNGIKAGAAASLFLIALAYNDKGNLCNTIIFILLSWGFHHSMVVPVVAFVICKIVKNPRYYLVFWCFSFLMALLRITFFQNLFAGFSDEGARYLISDGATSIGKFTGGFRVDFILYSFAPIILGRIAQKRKLIKSKKYEFLLNFYTLTNSTFMLCMYADYNNRIAYLSWFVLPILLVYPFLRESWGDGKYSVLKKVSYGHLGFTLMMQYIYYIFIR